MPRSGVARTDSPAVASPRPPLFPQVYQQSVHDAFVRLETRGGHVYNRREEDVEQEGREHAPLTKALLHREPPRAHPVVEPHACSHAIVELTNGRDHILWHAKADEYCPEEGSINGVVRFGKVDKAYIERNSFFRASSCNRRTTNIIQESVVERFGRKPLGSAGRIPTRSQYSLKPRAMIFSTILPACATYVVANPVRGLLDRKKIRGTSTVVQSSNESMKTNKTKTRQRRQKERVYL